MGVLAGKKGMEQRGAFGRVSEPRSSSEQWDCPHERSVQGQGKQPHQDLLGQEVWGQPPPPGLLRCRGCL